MTERPKYEPSRYMRDRHPDLFSDTVSEVAYEVEREVLSYHLETLTNQKDEAVFENFAQRLCEKFIAPNIRPQTGPVGGGDGKTDAETFPVSSEISARWFKRYGDDDVNDDLKITIVRGVWRDNPAAYAMMVSQNPDNVPLSEGNVVGFVSRINKMYPETTRNLDLFLEDYARHGRYLLIPAGLPNKMAQPEPIFELPIGKHKLTVMNAWEITTNDLAASVLDLDEPPYVPEDQPNAPVFRALEWLASLRR